MGTELGASARNPLGRELQNNLDKVRSYAFEIPFMRLGAVAVAAVEGAFVQRHRRCSVQRLRARGPNGVNQWGRTTTTRGLRAPGKFRARSSKLTTYCIQEAFLLCHASFR